MIVAPITISSLRQEVIDFTIPYLDLHIGVIMKKKEREKGFLDFMDPYTNEVWFLLVSGTVYVGLLLAICNKLSPYGYYGQVIQADANVLGNNTLLSSLRLGVFKVRTYRLGIGHTQSTLPVGGNRSILEKTHNFRQGVDLLFSLECDE